MKNMKKILSLLLSLVLMLGLCLSVNVSAADGDDYEVSSTGEKTIMVTATTEKSKGIQNAIDYIESLSTSDDASAKEEWTIIVSGGTYYRFTIYKDLTNLTVQAADGALVIISVLDGSDAPATTSGAYPETYGVSIRDVDSVTLSGLTFQASSDQSDWMAAAVSTHVETTEKASNTTIENCTFIGVGYDYGIAFAETGTWTVKNCTFDSFIQGIYFENNNWVCTSVTISNNIFTNCSFAIHGSFGMYSSKGSGDVGTFTFTDNTIVGNDSLRSKVVIQDSSGESIESVVITGNSLTNAMIGLINEGSDSILDTNTFDENSYICIAEDHEVNNGTVTLYSNYEASDDSHGRWVFTNVDYDLEIDWGGNESGTNEYVKSVIDEANESYSNTLYFTGIDTDNVLRVFTWFKDAIYWVGTDTDVEEPGITKTVDQSEVYAGDTVTFTLTSNVPEYLGIYMASAIKDIANDAYDENENDTLEDSELTQDYYLTFHDTMDYGDNLIVAEDSFVVTINGVTLTSDQYTLSTSNDDGCSYHITLNLTALCTAGVFSEDDIENSPAIVVTYTATVAEDADLTSYVNTAWVSFEDETSDTATAEVTVVEVESESEEEPDDTPDTTVEPTNSGEEETAEEEANEEEVETETSDNTAIYMYATLGLLAAGGYFAITKKNLLKR